MIALDRPQTEDQKDAACSTILSIKEEQRELWDEYDHLVAFLFRYMDENRTNVVRFHEHTFRRIIHKPTGSPSQRKKWRSMYPACAADLRIDFPKEKAA